MGESEPCVKWRSGKCVVYFLLGNSPASEFYMPTFRNTPFHLHKDGRVCSETSSYKIQTPGNYPEENIQHTEHDDSLKSGIVLFAERLEAVQVTNNTEFRRTSYLF
jgi:hypothetical protein